MTARAVFQRGFTMIEVLLVMVILGVLITIAVPSFTNYISSQKVKTASFDLYAAMLFARSEAIKRRVNVTVAATGGDWKNGWTVVATGVPDPLRTQDALTGVNISNTTTSVVYRLDGRLTSGAALGMLIQPQAADASIKNRCIRVDLTGLPKSTNTTTTTCP